MTLVTASLLAGVLLLGAGALLASYPPRVRSFLMAFPRCRKGAFVLLFLATAVVLYQVTQLGEADFGKYKHILFAFFLVLAVGAWFQVPDFLGVRALAVLGLLLAGVFLRAAFLEPPATRLFLVVFTYGVIVASIYLAAAPYRLRDALLGLDQRPAIRRGVGIGFSLYGLLLCLLPLSFGGA